MILSWLIVLAWIAVAVIAGAIAWFLTDRIAGRMVGVTPPAAAPRRKVRR